MAAPVKLNFIRTIKVSKLTYPLYDHTTEPAQFFFDIGEKTIYEDGQTDPYPIAVDNTVSFHVDFAFSAAQLEQMRGPYTLTATLYGSEVFSSRSEHSLDFSQLYMVQPMVNGRYPKALPWVLRKRLIWSFQDSSGNFPRYITPTPIEIYVFPSNLPKFFDKGGIPLTLLRNPSYLPAWMDFVWSGSRKYWEVEAPGSPQFTWAAFVVETVFSNDKLQYEQWGGACRYISSEYDTFRNLCAKNRGLSFWLDLWINEDRQITFPKKKITVNCYDLAALCMILVSLGIDSETTDLRMKYMEPFGYIKATSLIGRIEPHPNPKNPENKCNNPFYGNKGSYHPMPANDPQMLCDEDSPNRSGFGNHMFLTIASRMKTPYVLDACCGPQLGTLPLVEYPSAVIDTATHTRHMTSSGGVADIADGPGIDALVSSRCFGRSSRSHTPRSLTLLELVKSMVALEGRWNEPFLAVPADDRSITVTWTFEPLSSVELITINILKFTSGEDVKQAFAYRTDTLLGWQNSPTGGLECDRLGTGSIRMFKDEQRCYLATIETTTGNAASTYGMQIALQKTLESAFQWNMQQWNSIAGVTKNPSDVPQPVGTRIIVSMQIAILQKHYWRGFNVKVSKGHVLFVGASQEDDDSRVDFHFLARSPGFDAAIITLYGGNLETDRRMINFWIGPN